MVKRLFFSSFLVFLVLLLSQPASIITAQSTGYQEGADLSIDQGATIAFRSVHIHAVKTVEGNTRSAVFEFTMSCAGFNAARIGPVTLQVPIDIDYLSVSRDLGWAGLDADVMVKDNTSGNTVPVGIHIAWWATSGVTEADGQFQRPARMGGTITGPCTFDVTEIQSRPLNSFNFIRGFIFSTREPKPRY